MDIEVIGQDEFKARKPYICDMCGKEISVGERYEKTFCKDHDSGKSITYRLHKRCDEVVMQYNKMFGAIPDGLTFVDVAEIVGDTYCPMCAHRRLPECNGDVCTCKGL